MQFILNMSFAPHFCALFDAENALIEKIVWEDFKKGGEEVWEFLDRHKIYEQNLTFIGGVSGPGGFSSLRAGGAILNALSLKFGIPIHQTRADNVLAQFLETHNYPSSDFLLNSFSGGVFWLEKDRLVRGEIDALPSKITAQPQFVGCLPEEKQKKVPQTIDLSFEGIEATTLAVLQKSTAQKIFVPDYEYPAVQGTGLSE